MTATDPSRIGQVNGAGDALALFLKVFSGEVLATFDRLNVMMGLHRMRSIKHGKSAQFPAVGRATAAYHVVGEDITDTGAGYLTQFGHNERVISIDSKLLAATFVDELDEMLNHYEVRSEYAHQLGEALARTFDQQALQVAVLAARTTTPTITGNPAGESVVDADFVTNGASAAATIFSIAQKFDEKDIPESDRVIVVNPQTYYNLVQETDFINRDFTDSNGGLDTGRVMTIAGIKIVKSNNLPSTVVAADPGHQNTYSGDFTTTLAVAFHRSAIGTVKLMDLTMEQEYLVEKQGHLMVAKFALGTGILRPEAAIEVASA